MALDLGRLAPDPWLFRLTGLPVVVRDLYDVAAAFCSCRDLDWALAEPGSAVPGTADLDVLDLRDFAFDPAFRGVAMIDFFLRRLGVDPDEVAPAQRRNGWLSRYLSREGLGVPTPGYVLVCPRASMTLRTMPPAAHEAIIRTLSDLQARPVTQGEPPAGSGALAAPPAGSLAELCGWVAGASLIISTDTAMIHLADAFSVRCLAIFTTHRPEWRVRDYPLCRALYRPARGLPPALEFSRGPEDEAAAAAAWLDADGFRWLTDAVAREVAVGGFPVPS